VVVRDQVERDPGPIGFDSLFHDLQRAGHGTCLLIDDGPTRSCQASSPQGLQIPCRGSRDAVPLRLTWGLNCLTAVERADLFLGLITPQYGSGKEEDELSITHRELLRAIELNKPRWLLAHDRVIFARLLLNHLEYRGGKSLVSLTGKEGRGRLSLRKSAVMDDLRVIDMYEDAILSEKPLRERQGNWVQQFDADADALLFALAQFSRYHEVEEFVRENLGDMAAVKKRIENPEEGQ
jgi:hypothetical protein